MLTQEVLKEYLSYDPESGEFTWNKIPKGANKCRIGSVAGFKHPEGYRQITLLGRRYLAHRLAYFYMMGNFPINEIDHINRNRSDNRWVNLRAATTLQNSHNKAARGVHLDKQTNKWTAQISIDGKRTFLGRYESEELARSVYLAVALTFRGDFVCMESSHAA